jgi:hypothetical protein
LEEITETLGLDRAKLKLNIANNGSTGSQILKPVTDTSWSETGMTYNNRPGITNTTLATIPGGSANAVREVDLTAYVSQKAGAIMSLGVTSSSSNDVNFYSREASTASDWPVLTVTIK